MAYGTVMRQPAMPPQGRLGMAYDYYGDGTMGWNPFKAIGSAIKAVAKPVVSVAKAVLPAVPIVGGVAAGALELLTRSRQSPDSAAQSAYPGNAYPSTAPIVGTQQGVNILEAIKNELLRMGGQYIATTPQGQAAIQQEMMQQARLRAASTAQSVAPWALAAGIPLLLLLTTKKR